LNGQPASGEQVFSAMVSFIVEQNKLVETVYQMDRDHQFSGEGEAGLLGKPLIEGQLMKAGQLLGDVWFSAWQQAAPDDFLAKQLRRRSETPKADK